MATILRRSIKIRPEECEERSNNPVSLHSRSIHSFLSCFFKNIISIESKQIALITLATTFERQKTKNKTCYHVFIVPKLPTITLRLLTKPLFLCEYRPIRFHTCVYVVEDIEIR
jgi:hypothetical protein